LVFTLFLSSSGVGSICGSLIVAGMGNIRHKGRVALASLIFLGAAISCFALSRWVVLSCLMLFFAGAFLMAVFANVSSLVQLITPSEVRGRVMSVYNVAFRGGMPMGNLLMGWLVPMFTAPAVLAVNGLALIALAVYYVFGQRRVAAL
jgi:predicted MFS family arabinose efflux permease